jgi:L-fuculose-phosphate aldolase
MDKTEIARQILEVCRLLHEKNFLAAADGNVSYRISEDQILITPAGRHKGFLSPSDLALINLKNEILHGEPSSERLMHLAVYRYAPEARCVVHAHPPTAIAWSIARPELRELPFEALPEVILAVGRVPIVPYARPGTQDMGENLKAYLPEHRAMILGRHGALSWGESLAEAYNGMERLEHSALILKLAQEIASARTRLRPLPTDELRALQSLRASKGNQSL